jgi:hypothetical protein
MIGKFNLLKKLSLIGIQLPEKYKETFDVSSESPSSGITSQVNPDEGPSLEILLIFFR